jgi:hypothetical protein
MPRAILVEIMTHFKDLTKYAYHESEFYRPITLNVGWLERHQKFEEQSPADDVLDLLWSFCKVSVARMRGIHECDLDSCEDTYIATRGGERLILGSAEIRVFGENGVVYAAPTLIYHYVLAHRYKPPDQFLLALSRGPKPPSESYFDKLKQHGLDWTKTNVPPEGLRKSRRI